MVECRTGGRKAPLILAVVLLDHPRGRPRGVLVLQREAGQRVDMVGGAQGQGVPAVLPRATGSGVRIEHQEVHAALGQMVGG
ncbi:hypothetical protein AAHB37_03910 [Glutamicibacter halophytocola]|uniref:hypothetical protein n=1 Tax=Glutamicibacter halophytocola TaxID=1933880 RepID=UPI00321BF4E5